MEGFNWSDKHVLVTGGAGFIGSNLSEKLLELGARVTVIDNFSTGLKENRDRLLHFENYSFVEADICLPDTYAHLLSTVDLISHQAALGSVPRSIEFPLNTHLVNATGFLTLLNEAHKAGIKRIVYASSSSVYGDSLASPKEVGLEGNLLSPYAVTKKLNEDYAQVYSRLHQMECIGLRYFNVFGPHQNPEGVYAAAIPKFLDALLHHREIVIHGDGNQTRDFTYVDNAISANLLALTTENDAAFGNVFNVACGKNYSLNDLLKELRNGLEQKGMVSESVITYGNPRSGDIRDSLARVDRTNRGFGYEVKVSFEEGVQRLIDFAL